MDITYTETQKTRTALTAPWLYILANFAWTWLFWGTAAVLGLSVENPDGGMLMLAGIMGPLVTGIGFTYLTRDKAGRRDYWKRVIGFRRIPWKWYLVIFLFVPVLHILAAGVDMLTGGTGAAWGAAAQSVLSDPLSIIPSLLFATLIPFLEELGWRGYVLDRYQEKYTALEASLILGVIWSVWHLPLFYIGSTYQSELGVGTLAFWLFLLGILPLSICFTWIYNNTRRSILAVILFHAMVNFTGELIALSPNADAFSIGVWFAAALGVILLWGAKTLTADKPA